MKKREHRLHYNLKQMKKTDPRRVCKGYVKDSGYHLPGDQVRFVQTLRVEDEVFAATCQYCNARIEYRFGDLDERGDVIWRKEFYIIQEWPW